MERQKTIKSTNGHHYKIERGVEMPTSGIRGRGKPAGPFLQTLRTLEVGESFVVDDQKVTVIASVTNHLKRRENRAFSHRKLGEGQYRVWRTA
jgi:hypothetical protein